MSGNKCFTQLTEGFDLEKTVTCFRDIFQKERVVWGIKSHLEWE